MNIINIITIVMIAIINKVELRLLLPKNEKIKLFLNYKLFKTVVLIFILNYT